MDIGDYIFIAQTTIVLATGLVVVYYARETHKLRRTSERHMQLTAKIGLLAAYMQNLTVTQMRNTSRANQGRTMYEDTSELTAQINKLETEINQLTAESD
jgi:hypothetical protein